MRSTANLIALFLTTLVFAGSTSLLLAQNQPVEPYDIVITGGRIVDGTGNSWFYGDLAVKGDRIARITPAGLLRNAPAKTRIDARGLVVAPGFIDIQSHSRDSFLTGDGRVISKVTQGITTEILGEGWTDAPANDLTLGSPGTAGPSSRHLGDSFRNPHGFSKWLEAMERHGASANFGSFLGATTARVYVKGMAQGAPTSDEVDAMRQLVREAMEDGAFGIASALIYPPASFQTTEELIEMAKAMSPYGGVYISHMRSEADQLLEAIDEAIRIGREGGVPVEIYHLKAGGRRNWPKALLAIKKINDARDAGQDVQANMYPYVAGSTGLSACFPPWASADGKLMSNLHDPAARAKMKAEMLKPRVEWENLCQLATPRGVLVLGVNKPDNKVYAGKRLSQIAAIMHKHWADAAMDLVLSEEQRIATVFFMMSERNVKLQLRQPWVKIGTDSGGSDPDNPVTLVHPRSYGTYPRILGKYVRDEKVITLEDAVRKMSSAVAERLSIQDRGILREGKFADVVIFDPATVIDRATFEKPHEVSAGVRHVLVNGVAVVADGKHTGAKPGRALRGPGYKSPATDASR
ncbi:MAG TPA: D-aminoacylase [Blastocatellia bacterium]|nr:D-aminoacylase [Blastocatellia bacterium]